MIVNSPNPNLNKLNNRSNLLQQEAFFFICQITGFNESKINKVISGQFDMIIDFDFFINKGKE